MPNPRARELRGKTQEADDSWVSYLSVDLRSGEAGLCWLLFAVHFLLLSFQYTAKALRQSIFIDSLGAERLPIVYLLVALCSYPLLIVHARMVDRWAQGRLIAVSALAFLWLRPHLGEMLLPVLAYIVVITLMVIGAWAAFSQPTLSPRGPQLLFVGAIMFYLSDLFVARDRFVKEGWINRLLGLPLYYLGQFLLAFSIGLVA